MRPFPAFAVLLLFGCGDDGLAPPIDPIIVSLTADPLIVAAGERSTITAEGYDREHQALTFSWEASGGTVTGTGDSVVWTAPEVEGTYSVFLTILDQEGGFDTDSVVVDVWNGTLLINTGVGLLAYGFDGGYFGLTEGRIINGTELLKGDDVEVLGTKIYLSGVNGEYRVLEIGQDGRVISSTSPSDPGIYAAGFTVLPDGALAVLDNYSDFVYILAPDGSRRAKIPIPNPARGLLGLQVLDGLVVGNRLIASENGKGQVFEIDLATYETSIVHDLFEPDSWLGAIAQDGDGTFHVYRAHTDGGRIYSFTEGGLVRKLCTLPEKHVSRLASVGTYLFAAVNHAGALYRIHRLSGRLEKILGGLDWPTDVEYLPVSLNGS